MKTQKNSLKNPNSEYIAAELDAIKEDIQLLKIRNQEKDENKEWETSLVRKFLIGLFTYLVMILVMGSIGVADPHINAIVPTLGFILSTLSLSVFKIFWSKKGN